MQDNIIELHHETNKIDDLISIIHQIEGRKSHAAMVIGSSKFRVTSCSMLEEDEIVLNECDYIIEKNVEYPLIRFSECIHSLIDKNMQKSVIVCLLGRAIGFKALESRIQTLWKPQGRFQLMDLENNYFIIRLECEEDYVKVDYNTSKGERGRFTRLAILIGLNKPLLPYIGIDDFIQKLEYEGLQLICFNCNLYGHTNEHCPSLDHLMGPAQKEGMSTPENHQHNQPEQRLENNQQEDMYGPWMVAETKRR
ncbi:hypothetical protein F3Y22_tig00116962pilonHSYRG00593 [Hibiscus syriacus]|uniref:CCHC-type domain-containing protein n=1 Tax=Hibiscus syriacus TaxID=106335 RepID=A0A6A2WK11_HIBSY|nr:hypothetical protein F3Y22_tig00116962pilonHSYRG00593 [Hibiscus syriacus]